MKIEVLAVLFFCDISLNGFSSAFDVGLGNAAISRKSVDSLTSGIFLVSSRGGARFSGNLRRWAAYISNEGTLAFLILSKTINGDGTQRTIKYSQKVTLSSRDVGKVYEHHCKHSCPYIDMEDEIGFYFDSPIGGMIPYDVIRPDDCTPDKYLQLASNPNHLNHTRGVTHIFHAAPSSWGACRTYSLSASVESPSYSMQELSRFGQVYDLENDTHGIITSQSGPVFALKHSSKFRVRAPSSGLRIRLSFVGPVQLSGTDSRASNVGICSAASRNWLSVYEYVDNTKKYILPEICGNWDDNKYMIPVLPELISQTSQLYLEFNTISSDNTVNSGFVIEFSIYLPEPRHSPLYILDMCNEKLSKPRLSINGNNTRVRSMYSSRHFPSSTLEGAHDSLDCDIRIVGETRRETFALVFTWLQLPSPLRTCRSTSPYLKVIDTSKKDKRNLLMICGKRTPYILLTKSSDITIQIKGNIGYGFAFKIYSSSEEALSVYSKPRSILFHDFSPWFVGVMAFTVIIVVCSIRSAARDPNSVFNRLKLKVRGQHQTTTRQPRNERDTSSPSFAGQTFDNLSSEPPSYHTLQPRDITLSQASTSATQTYSTTSLSDATNIRFTLLSSRMVATPGSYERLQSMSFPQTQTLDNTSSQTSETLEQNNVSGIQPLPPPPTYHEAVNSSRSSTIDTEHT